MGHFEVNQTLILIFMLNLRVFEWLEVDLLNIFVKHNEKLFRRCIFRKKQLPLKFCDIKYIDFKQAKSVIVTISTQWQF